MNPTKEQLKEMLIKYRHHIIRHEGIDFLDDGWKDDIFSDEEWDYMRKLNGDI